MVVMLSFTTYVCCKSFCRFRKQTMFAKFGNEKFCSHTLLADYTRYLCVDEVLVLGVIIDALKHSRASEVIDSYAMKDRFIRFVSESCSYY